MNGVNAPRAVVRGKGSHAVPRLTRQELDEIRKRAESLDPHGQTKADIYRLLIEAEHALRTQDKQAGNQAEKA